MNAIRVALALSAVLLCSESDAAAQGPTPEIRVGGGYNYLWYPESAEGGLGLRASARFPMSPTLSLEPEFTFGHRAESQRYSVGRTTAKTNSWSVGLNVIRMKAAGTVRPYAGGGAGIFMRRRVFETIIESGPQAGVFPTVHETGPLLSGQALAGLDVEVSKAAALFGEFRVSALAVSGGGVGFWYLGGVRIALR